MRMQEGAERAQARPVGEFFQMLGFGPLFLSGLFLNSSSLYQCFTEASDAFELFLRPETAGATHAIVLPASALAVCHK